MSSVEYIGVPIDTNPESIQQDIIDFIQAAFPGWVPNPASLDYMLARAIAIAGAEARDVASAVPTTVFRYFGQKLLGLPPQDAVAAQTTSTWSLTDANGHEIPAGTQVTITDNLGTPQPFKVLNTVVVAPGENITAAGAVTLVAVNPGAASSGIGVAGGHPQLEDIYDFVVSPDGITLVAPTSGGEDAETDAEYLDRLTRRLRLLTPRPILPADFAAMAQEVDGVFRAVAIDGYNPADGTYNNARMVTLAAQDVVGAAVSPAIKDDMATYVGGFREVNFIVNTMDPQVTLIDVEYHVVSSDLYNPADTEANVNAALDTLLSPLNWGVPGLFTDRWVDDTVLRFFDVVRVIGDAAGVDHIIDVKIAAHLGVLAAADVNLNGPASLTGPGDYTPTVD